MYTSQQTHSSVPFTSTKAWTVVLQMEQKTETSNSTKGFKRASSYNEHCCFPSSIEYCVICLHVYEGLSTENPALCPNSSSDYYIYVIMDFSTQRIPGYSTH